jgi:Telomere resolvase
MDKRIALKGKLRMVTAQRSWLETDITKTYLPALKKLKDNAAGHREATKLLSLMRDDWARRNLVTITQQYSCLADVRKAIKSVLGEDHWSLKYIEFSRKEHVERNNQQQERVMQRNSAVKFLDDPEAIVAMAVRLLESSEWAEVAAGLSVVTGRRIAELLSTAEFTLKSKWSVVFTGAVKRKEEPVTLSFEIPTLTIADRVMKALKRLRGMLPETKELEPRQINRSYGQAVSKACDEHFAALIPLREGKENLYTHISRSVYATIAVFWFCPESVDPVEYKARVQGHFQGLNEQDQTLRPSLEAGRHYSDYAIAAKVIAEFHGRSKGIKLGHGGVEVIEAYHALPDAPQAFSKGKREQRGSIHIHQADKPLLEAVLTRLGVSPDANQQDKIRTLLLWVQQQLDGGGGSMAPLSQAATPVEAKLNKLVDAVSTLVQLQLQPASVAITAPAATAPSVPRPPKRKAHDPETEQRIAEREANTQRIHQAIEAIMAHNDTQGEVKDRKWAITINALKSYVNSQAKIQRILDERADEISAHHTKHEIDSDSHNLRHRRKHTITDVIPLSQHSVSS